MEQIRHSGRVMASAFTSALACRDCRWNIWLLPFGWVFSNVASNHGFLGISSVAEHRGENAKVDGASPSSPVAGGWVVGHCLAACLRPGPGFYAWHGKERGEELVSLASRVRFLPVPLMGD